MKISHIPLAASLFAAASVTTLASTSHAVVALTTFTETGDAGQTLMTADATASSAAPAGSGLSTIYGSFANASDADLYTISIPSPMSFSATTVNSTTNTSEVDTELFLFNASGVAIAVNDDANGTSIDSTLPTGNALYANLAAGTYYLGISSSGNEAINSASQLLFSGYPGGDTTAVRGAASGVNPTTESNFNGNEYDTTTSGAYEIDLTGVATAGTPAGVPEPTSWTAFALGGLAAAATIFRRRVA